MESERLRNTLLAAISHDVRTPLTALIGLAESLQARLARPEHQPAGADNHGHGQPTHPEADTAGAIAQQAHQLAALVTNLLDMARLQDGGIHLRSDWQSIQEVVGGAIRAASHALAGLRVETHVPADLPLVEFDAVLMERVLVNLLENAARYGAAPITVSAHAASGELVLQVRDHGAGLPAAAQGDASALFEKFTRGAAESSTPGVGLGLAICKAVIDAHGGSITAANAAGGGAEFTVRLPRRTPPSLVEG